MSNQTTESIQLSKDDLKPPKVVRKRKKKSKVYFGTPVQEAVIRYNNEKSISKRNKIYQEEIHAAFMKLAENLIHTFKFYHFDYPSTDVQHEVVAFLVINMAKYKPDKGRAFSYFSIVAKNWLILHNNGNYKKYKTHMKLDAEAYKRNMAERSDEENQQEDIKAFVSTIVPRFEDQLTSIFRKKRDIQIADAVLELFRRRDIIENFNKKALYVLIREMTGYKTQHITKVINVLKKHYAKLFNDYHNNNGNLPPSPLK
jgi:DNA-directed RNA polymerase subunit F